MLPSPCHLPHSAGRSPAPLCPSAKGPFCLISWNHGAQILSPFRRPHTQVPLALRLSLQEATPGAYPSLLRRAVLCFSPSHRAATPASPRALAARSRLLRCLLRATTVHRLLQQAAVRWHFINLQKDVCVYVCGHMETELETGIERESERHTEIYIEIYLYIYICKRETEERYRETQIHREIYLYIYYIYIYRERETDRQTDRDRDRERERQRRAERGKEQCTGFGDSQQPRTPRIPQIPRIPFRIISVLPALTVLSSTSAYPQCPLETVRLWGPWSFNLAPGPLLLAPDLPGTLAPTLVEATPHL